MTNFETKHLPKERDTLPLAAVAVTMPPWAGEGEAIIIKGEWEPTTS
jgi:mannose-6-phosphate isomerase-like protein (cupin superfamily)